MTGMTKAQAYWSEKSANKSNIYPPISALAWPVPDEEYSRAELCEVVRIGLKKLRPYLREEVYNVSLNRLAQAERLFSSDEPRAQRLAGSLIQYLRGRSYILQPRL